MAAKRRTGPTGAVLRLALVVALLALVGSTEYDQPAAGAVRQPEIVPYGHITKSEFIRRLARLCDARARAIDRLGVPFTSPGDYARRGSDLIRIDDNFNNATHALPRPAHDRLLDLSDGQYKRYRHLLPPLISSSRRGERLAWALMYEAQGYLKNASDIIQYYGHRRFCDLGAA